MKKGILLIGLLALALLVGCGGSDDTPTAEGVHITCMDVNITNSAACDGVLMSQSGIAPEVAGASLMTSLYNASDVSILNAAVAIIEMQNNELSDFYGIAVLPLFVNGCGSNGFVHGPVTIASGNLLARDYYNNYCANADLGPQHFTITLYNGSAESVEFFMANVGPEWNATAYIGDPANPWDWSVIDADMASYGHLPVARAKVLYNYVP